MIDYGSIGQIGSVGVISTPDQDHVNKSHAGDERDDAGSHDLVLTEETFVPHVAASESCCYDDEGEDGAPPAVEKRRVVGDAGATLGWRVVVESAWQYHGR